MRASACLFLLSLTAGCASNPPVVPTVYQQVYLPDHFLAECPGVEWRGGSFEDVGALAAARKKALKDCNDRLAAARQYQADIRAKSEKSETK